MKPENRLGLWALWTLVGVSWVVVLALWWLVSLAWTTLAHAQTTLCLPNGQYTICSGGGRSSTIYPLGPGAVLIQPDRSDDAPLVILPPSVLRSRPREPERPLSRYLDDVPPARLDRFLEEDHEPDPYLSHFLDRP